MDKQMDTDYIVRTLCVRITICIVKFTQARMIVRDNNGKRDNGDLAQNDSSQALRAANAAIQVR